MSKKSAGTVIAKGIFDIVTDKTVQKTILGKYTDGSTRSLIDALTDEIISPKDREKYIKKGKKKKNKKKKKLHIDF